MELIPLLKSFTNFIYSMSETFHMLVLFPVLIYTSTKSCFVVKQVAARLPGSEVSFLL